MIIEDIHEHFRLKVKNSTGDYQINTYVVLNDNSLLNTDNLEKTIEYASIESQKFFFSREWEQAEFDQNKISWSFPVLIVNQDDVDLQSPFKKSGKRLYKFDFYLLLPVNTVFEQSDIEAENMFISWLQSFDAKIINRIKERKRIKIERIRHKISTHDLSGVMCQGVIVELNNCL